MEKMSQFVASMRANSIVLQQISDYNERMRRRCQHELQMAKSDLDD